MKIKFFHGLGDTSNFARVLPLYKKYGINLEVEVSKEKRILLEVCNTELTEEANEDHCWCIQSENVDTTLGNNRGWSGNKVGENLECFGLATKANMEELWAECKKVDIQLKNYISQPHWDKLFKIIENWPRPLILWHSMGNTNSGAKDFSKLNQDNFLHKLIDETNGTIILLDWDNRVSWTLNNRIKHLMVDIGPIDLPGLAALMYSSQLFIGIDSGPFYFSALTSIPSIGIYFDRLHPCEYMIPCPRALTFSMGSKSHRYDPSKRFEFQIIGTNNKNIDHIISWVPKMLGSNRYLPNDYAIASDVQLQQIVKEKCRGYQPDGLSTIYDRNVSFDILLKECKTRFLNPKFIETGCIRKSEDWSGAGYSTALFGRYCQLTNGSLTSFDLDPNNVKFAQQYCRQFGNAVKVICCKGSDGIKDYDSKIDVLYLDSLDTNSSGHQECNLEEFKEAESKLHDSSIVVIDDTPSLDKGKGGLTVKYMLEKGYKMLYAGYQVVLSKRGLT